MFGHAYFGASYFGASYWGPASGVVPPVVVVVDTHDGGEEPSIRRYRENAERIRQSVHEAIFGKPVVSLEIPDLVAQTDDTADRLQGFLDRKALKRYEDEQDDEEAIILLLQ